MKWYQLWVSRPNGQAVELMKRIDPLLQKLGALPCAPDGTPIMNGDGTIEVRVYSGGTGLDIAKKYLADSGFVVERETENE